MFTENGWAWWLDINYDIKPVRLTEDFDSGTWWCNSEQMCLYEDVDLFETEQKAVQAGIKCLENRLIVLRLLAYTEDCPQECKDWLKNKITQAVKDLERLRQQSARDGK